MSDTNEEDVEQEHLKFGHIFPKQTHTYSFFMSFNGFSINSLFHFNIGTLVIRMREKNSTVDSRCIILNGKRIQNLDAIDIN